MPADSKGRDLFIVDNSVSGWSGLRYQQHAGDSWRHAKITLQPNNPHFEPILLTGQDDQEFQVIAEFLEVLRDSGE